MDNRGRLSFRAHVMHYILLYGVGILLFMSLPLLYYFPAQDAEPLRTLVVASHPIAGSTLLTTLSTNRIDARNQAVVLTLDASRATQTRLDDLQVCLDAPGFRIENPTDCLPIPVRDRNQISASSATVSIRLVPIHTSGRYQIRLNASWTQYLPSAGSYKHSSLRSSLAGCEASGSHCMAQRQEQILTFPPVRVEISRWPLFLHRLSSVLKDLTLPIVLLLIGHWLNTRAAEREKTKHQEEKNREEEHQIARLLLPKIMNLSNRYYLHLCSHGEQAARFIGPAKGRAREVLFHILAYFLIARGLKDQAGGIFLKNLYAERVFANAHRVLRMVLVEASGGEASFDALLDELEQCERSGHWPRYANLPAASGSPQWAQLELWLCALPAAQQDALRYFFNIITGTLRYECNVPFDHWYSEGKSSNPFKTPLKIADPDPEVFGPSVKEFILAFKDNYSIYSKQTGNQP
jgi:hypothetical protein